MITFHSFAFLPDWLLLNWEGEERESGREFLSLLKVLCEDGWVSVHYRKGPDHHWMTLLGATKPNWSRPPAANGPERNSPGWVMTVFYAFLFTPSWCPHTHPHLTPVATSPVPSPYLCFQLWVLPWSSPGVIYTVFVISVCVMHLATDAVDRSGRRDHGTICWDKWCSSCFSQSSIEEAVLEKVGLSGIWNVKT